MMNARKALHLAEEALAVMEKSATQVGSHRADSFSEARKYILEMMQQRGCGEIPPGELELVVSIEIAVRG